MFIIAVFAMCDLHCYMLTFHFLKCQSCIFCLSNFLKVLKVKYFFYTDGNQILLQSLRAAIPIEK